MLIMPLENCVCGWGTDSKWKRQALGILYNFIHKNIGRAVHYLKLAANQKNEFALYRLGKLYLAGGGGKM